MKARSAKEEAEAVKAELDKVSADYKKLRVRMVDIEEGSSKRSKALEEAVRERDLVFFPSF